MPSVDLFSAFAGSGDEAAILFRTAGSELSEEGMEFAAKLMARALQGR
jgi:hypothetical protein